jgi:hypothetical protein
LIESGIGGGISGGLEVAAGLFKGLPQRGPRVALAIPMYVFSLKK